MKSHDFIEWLAFFQKDENLTVWHLSLLTAILTLGYRQGENGMIRVSRSKIMALSHIHTLPTYHKYLKELQLLGYIKYTPSYHPGYRSRIELLFRVPKFQTDGGESL